MPYRRSLALAALAGLAIGLPPALAAPAAPVAPVGAPAEIDLAQPLPADPALVTGTLENGLDYVVLRHPNPAGQAHVQLRVHSGSLNETEEQRGIAHFLEHMAFNGSENFEKNDVIRFFERMGMTFGRDQNAYTSFDETTYILQLPRADAQTLADGLRFFRDVAGGLNLDPEDIEAEKAVVLEELRTGKGAQQRVTDELLRQIAPGSTLGRRLPIGTEETIRGFTPELVREYYERWYTPSNMTLIVAADADPAEVVAQIERAFGDLPARGARPEPRGVGIEPYEALRAIVTHDPELSVASVGLLRIAEPEGATRTWGDLRKAVVDGLASVAFNTRMQAKVSGGSFEALGVGMGSQDAFGIMRWTQAQATGRPDAWRTMLQQLITEVQRARLHGFGEGELEDAKRALTAQLEQAAARAGTMISRARVGQISRAIGAGDALTSAEQDLDIVRRLLPTITLDEVNAAFAGAFGEEEVAVLVQLPDSAGVPTEEELLAAGESLIRSRPEAEAEEARAESLLPEAPPAGKVAELSQHPVSGVWSAWLSNDVRVHHRAMDRQENVATVRITLAGGAIQETGETRGIAEAAATAWSRPTTRNLRNADIVRLMSGVKASVSGAAGTDTMTLTVTGHPDDLEEGLKLAYLLLTEPRVDEVAVEQWRTARLQQMEAEERDPRLMIRRALGEAIAPESEPRLRPATREHIRAAEASRAQAWLDQLVRTAPIEVSVVGDIDRDTAFDLVARYIGSLPERERIGAATLDRLRDVPRPDEDIRSEIVIDTQTADKAAVISGFFAADREEVRDRRVLDVAAQIASTRMLKKIREEEGLVYSIGAYQVPAEAFPGYGMMLSLAPTDPHNAERLARSIQEVFDALAAEGVTEEELEIAVRQQIKSFEDATEQPGFWSDYLASKDYRGDEIDVLLDTPELLGGITRQELQETFRKYHGGRPSFTVIIRPKPAATEQAPAPGAEEPVGAGA